MRHCSRQQEATDQPALRVQPGITTNGLLNMQCIAILDGIQTDVIGGIAEPDLATK